MDNRLLFYDYDASLRYFEERLFDIKQCKMKNSNLKTIAKPILLLSALKAIEDGSVVTNHFSYDEMKVIYEGTFREFFLKARQENLTPMYNPWYYMKTDGFWQLVWKQGEMTTPAPGEGWIKRYVSHGRLSDELWTLVCNKEYRKKLMEFIVEKKIVAVVDNNKDNMVAEGLHLKQLLTILLAI